MATETSLLYIFGGVKGLPCKNFSVTCFFLVSVVNQIVLVTVRCPAKAHCTAAFALQNGKFQGLGGLTLIPLLNFFPGWHKSKVIARKAPFLHKFV